MNVIDNRSDWLKQAPPTQKYGNTFRYFPVLSSISDTFKYFRYFPIISGTFGTFWYFPIIFFEKKEKSEKKLIFIPKSNLNLNTPALAESRSTTDLLLLHHINCYPHQMNHKTQIVHKMDPDGGILRVDCRRTISAVNLSSNINLLSK